MSEKTNHLCDHCKHSYSNKTRNHPAFASVTQYWCDKFGEYRSVRYCSKFDEEEDENNV